MAASVRIEDDAFSDTRYDVLARLCGLADADHARGKMARLWRQCTAEHRHQLDVHDVESVLGSGGAAALVRARLGEMISETEVRIKGTRGRIEWLKKLRKGNSKGGKSRADKGKRDENGRLVKASSTPGQPGDGPGDSGPALSSPPAPAPAPAPALLNTTPAEPSKWRPGEPVASVADFEAWVAWCGWGVQVAGDDRAKVRALCMAAPIEPHELDPAQEAADRKKRGPGGRIPYAIGVITNTRRDAAEEVDKHGAPAARAPPSALQAFRTVDEIRADEAKRLAAEESA